MNNPLKYTDPSGYFFKFLKKVAKVWRSAWRSIKKYGRQIVAIVAAFYTGGATLAAGWSVWASGAAAGFVSGAISTGSLKGAIRGSVLGGVTASVANHIGHGESAFAKWAQKDVYNKAIAHGLSQGTISQISDGNFKEGFLSGAFSSYTRDTWLDTSSGDVFTNTMISSVSGGIAAELGGGKFANGAMTAAFVSLYNHDFQEKHQHISNDPNSPFKYIKYEGGLRFEIHVKGVCVMASCLTIDLIDWNKSKRYEAYVNNRTLKLGRVTLDAVNLIPSVSSVRGSGVLTDLLQSGMQNEINENNKIIYK
jgi:hypothetical protein